jgi:hypothetical protein
MKTRPPTPPCARLGLLFWFYARPLLCRNRLALLRRYHPATPIYGLYGGPPDDAPRFVRALSDQLDDLYVFRSAHGARWRWQHGDLMIADWFHRRGRNLPEWDTVAVVQWDLLAFDTLDRLLTPLRPGELVLTGLRPAAEVAAWWYWTRPGTSRRAAYDAFQAYLRRQHGAAPAPWACQFILAALPRPFLARYTEAHPPELGFLEYKLPTYARLFGTPMRALAATPGAGPASCWAYDSAATTPGTPLNADGLEVSLLTVWRHLRQPDGARLFHPFERRYPLSWADALAFAWQTISRKRHLASLLRGVQGLVSAAPAPDVKRA